MSAPLLSPRAETSGRRMFGIAALVALVVQNTALVVLMKHSYRAGSPEYSSSAAVALAEVLKVFTCFVLSCNTEGFHTTLDALRQTPKQMRLALPCVLYAIQNNLLFVAIKNLPTTLYVVCSQGKIVTSAFFSAYILKTKITRSRGIAFLLLTFGMIMVQMPSGSSQGMHNYHLENGLVAVFVACCTSGFAGVYLERIYKQTLTGSSVMTKNMQLSNFSMPISLLLAYSRDFEAYKSVGFFHGIDKIVVFVIILQALGGVIVALVMRHSSNLLKCFAVSISICLCSIISVSQGQEELSLRLILGIFLVNLATFIYSYS